MDRVADRKTSTIAYKAIFEVFLRCGILAYHAAFNNAITPLPTIQNIVVRRMGVYDNKNTTEEIYKSLGILPLRKLFIQNLTLECTVKTRKKQENRSRVSDPLTDTIQEMVLFAQ